VKTYNPVHFDIGNDSLLIPSIPDRPSFGASVGSGLDYRDRPVVLTTECDRGDATRYLWDEARREVVIRLYCNRPDKKEIDAAVERHQKQHGEVAGVVAYVDPVVYQDFGPLFDLWGFERDISRERPRVPYLALTRATAKKIPERPTVEESEADRKLRGAKALVRGL
jgi:hypothetical protein